MKPPITVDPEIMSGQPVFSGTRVPVETPLGYILDGNTLDEFLEDFPTVSRESAVCMLNHANQALLETVADDGDFLPPIEQVAQVWGTLDQEDFSYLLEPKR